MKKIYVFSIAASLTCIRADAQKTAPSLRGNGITFTENKGQVTDNQKHVRPDILYKGDGAGVDVYLRKTGVSYVLSNLVGSELIRYHRVDVDFEGCNEQIQTETSDKVEGYRNYYYPHCPNGVTHVNSYNEVLVKNIYKNTDVRYYGKKESGLEYDILVNPGGDPSAIQLKYSGAKRIGLKDNKLLIETSLEPLGEYIPKVYQQINGQRLEVSASYAINYPMEPGSAKGTQAIVSFNVGSYNPDYTLVIDPWVTYFGGSKMDEGVSVTTDSLGNSIFTGATASLDFPATSGAFQTVNKAGSVCAYFLSGVGSDAYVAKMSAGGNLDWATFFGGTGGEGGSGVACDVNSNILVAGITTSKDLPVQLKSGSGFTVQQSKYGGGADDAFLLKLDSAGVLQWATYYGGALDDLGLDVATDRGGNAYLYGSTTSTNAIASFGAFQGSLKGVGTPNTFVTKFLPGGSLGWGTYLGGSGSSGEIPGGIACDKAGNVYVAGTTSSSDFPATPQAYRSTYVGGAFDAFVFKFSPGGGPVWGTYFGSTSTDEANALAIDSRCNVYIDGRTNGTSGIATSGAFQTAFIPGSGHFGAYIEKFDSSGHTRKWGTYVSGNATVAMPGYGDIETTGLACDKNDNVLIAGDTYYTDLPVTSCAFQTTFAGTEDQFFGTFDSTGTNLCLGYLGKGNSSSPNNETALLGSGGYGGCIAVYGCYLYLSASTACDYPVTPGAFQSVCKTTSPNETGAFAQLYINSCGGLTKPSLNFTAASASLCKGQSTNFTPSSLVSTCSSTQRPNYSWTFKGGTPGISSNPNPVIKYDSTGSFDVNLIVQTSCWTDTLLLPAYVKVTVPSLNFSHSDVTCIGDSNGTATVSVNGNPPYTYSWSPGGSTNDPITGTKAGTYKVTVSDSKGCQSSDSVKIGTTQTTPLIAGFTSNPSGSISANTSVQFTNTSSGAISWLWNFGDPSSGLKDSSSQQNPSHLFDGVEKYCVLLIVKDSLSCSNSVSQCLEATEISIFVPNVFSPNGDGYNDTFQFTAKGIQSLTYDIYDRWGLLLFKGDAVNAAWNGRTQSGSMVPDGTYYYVYKAESYTSKAYNGSGFVQLLVGNNK